MNAFLVSLIVATLALTSFANVVPSSEQNLFSDDLPAVEIVNMTSLPNATSFDMAVSIGELMNGLAKIMPCGNATYGIPPLAPYRIPALKVNFTEGPLSLKGEIESLVVVGLDEFTIIQLTTNKTTNRTVMDMIHKDIQVLGQFNLNVEANLGGYKQSQPLKGFVNFQLLNVRVTSAMVIGPNEVGGIQFSNMEYTLQVGDVVVNNLNTEWSVDVNNYVNRSIRDFALVFLQTNREAYGKWYSEYSTKMANEALRNIPFETLAESIEVATKFVKSMSC